MSAPASRLARTTTLLALVFCTGMSGAAEECSGWALLNPPQDYDAQVVNQKAVLDLLSNGLTVYWVAGPKAGPGGTRMGDYVVPMQEGADYARAVLRELTPAHQKMLQGATAFKGMKMAAPRVAVETQMYFHWYYEVVRRGGFRFGSPKHNAADLAPYNLFVAPGGGNVAVTEEYNQVLRDFVRSGRGYLGSCFGAAKAVYPSRVSYATGSVGASLVEADNVEVARKYGALGGTGSVEIKMEAPAHPVLWNLPPEKLKTLYFNGPVLKGRAPSATVLASLKTALFAKGSVDAEEEYGKAIWIAGQRDGEGKVVVFGDHPEAPPVTGGEYQWQECHRACFNAILWCCAGPVQEARLPSPRSAPPTPWFRRGAESARMTAEIETVLRKTIAVRRSLEKIAVTAKVGAEGTDQTPGSVNKSLSFNLAMSHADFCRMELLLPRLAMTGGADRAGRFAKTREQLLADLTRILGFDEFIQPIHMPTEVALQLEQWTRDYERFERSERQGR